MRMVNSDFADMGWLRGGNGRATQRRPEQREMWMVNLLSIRGGGGRGVGGRTIRVVDFGQNTRDSGRENRVR